MIISNKKLSVSDSDITTMSTPDGYRDYLNRSSGIEYRIAITDDEEDQWDSIATDPMVYPLESVSMTYVDEPQNCLDMSRESYIDVVAKLAMG